ncbi:MAG: hypothetical protein VR64_17175 [Desulfatitalea sp. BRH_c12]|nr:MAG: hypothetical protein VR64_17175 [Desulfatitalea sp. BRH_c12]
MDLIVKMKFGAHLYGTAGPTSDVDYKGVFLPSREEILLARIPKSRMFSTGDAISKNTATDIDEEIYSLHYFIQLAAGGQTVAMDMLHAPETFWLVHTDIWREIVRQRQRFYTKNIGAFVTYARRQAAKYGIKGSRLHAAATVLTLLKSTDPTTKLRDLWNRLPRNAHCFDAGQDPNGMRLYQVCGKTFQESAAVGYVIPILEKFHTAYGERARLAAENKNIDWKAVSHALRATLQTRDILTFNTIRYPLPDAPFLMQVKAGQLDYTGQVAPILESLIDDVEQLLQNSPLPDKVDDAYWDRFICETLESHRFKRS